jgi:ribosomal protein S27E
MDRCQGVENTITPQIIELVCPECGEELEMFSSDESVTCTCGRVILNTSNLPLSVGAKA